MPAPTFVSGTPTAWHVNDFTGQTITDATDSSDPLEYAIIKGGLWEAPLQLRNCSNVLATKNELAGSGVYMKLWGGDASTLTPGNVTIDQLNAHDLDVTSPVEIVGCGNTLQYSTIFNTQDRGFQWAGPLHTIRYNAASNTCISVNDSAAFYCWSGTSPDFGLTFEYNVARDVKGPSGADLSSGLYLDNHWSASSILGNHFRNIAAYGILGNGGRDVTVSQNIFDGTFGIAGIGILERSNDPWPVVSYFQLLLDAGYIAKWPLECDMTSSHATVSGLDCYTGDSAAFPIGWIVDRNQYGPGVTLLHVGTWTGITASSSTTRSATNVQYTNNTPIKTHGGHLTSLIGI